MARWVHNMVGVPCEKCPLDLWIYQELIFRTTPDVIVECGVNYGGSAMYYASLLDLRERGEVLLWISRSAASIRK